MEIDGDVEEEIFVESSPKRVVKPLQLSPVTKAMANAYGKKVKARFEAEPEKFARFMVITKKFHRSKHSKADRKEVFKGLGELFQGHQDLIDEVIQFFPVLRKGIFEDWLIFERRGRCGYYCC
jgi:histone deacetylase complex regulatory component SIN3